MFKTLVVTLGLALSTCAMQPAYATTIKPQNLHWVGTIPWNMLEGANYIVAAVCKDAVSINKQVGNLVNGVRILADGCAVLPEPILSTDPLPLERVADRITDADGDAFEVYKTSQGFYVIVFVKEKDA